MSANDAYPYPELARLLKPLCTPSEFLPVATGWKPMGNPLFGAYLEKLPSCLFARCPFCAREYVEPVDIYNIGVWSRGVFDTNVDDTLSSINIYLNSPKPASCRHYMGLQVFVNLREQAPNEVRQPYNFYYHVGAGEVPYLSPNFFQANIPTKAVLHGIPIYQAVGEQFVPAYTVFVLTYFSLHRNALRDAILEAQIEPGKVYDDDYIPSLVNYPNGDQKNYDLPYWVAQGKLGWLDITDSDYLLLNFRDDAEFPAMYQNIPGIRRPYTYYRGQRKWDY